MFPDPLFLNVHMYGIMISLGILCALWVMYAYGKKMSVGMKLLDFFFYDSVASILFGFGFAAVAQGFYDYLENPEKGFHIGNGITFIGGIIGGAALFLTVYLIFRKKYENKFVEMLSVFAPSIVLAHSLGRVGCFFAGCCYGKPTDSVFGVVFPNAKDHIHPALQQKVHPTQLYEAIFLLLLFLIFSYLILKKKYRYNMPIYLISYGVFRFGLEFLRDDARGKFIGSLTPSQFWSVMFVIGGIVLFIALKKHDKKQKNETEEYEKQYGGSFENSFEEE